MISFKHLDKPLSSTNLLIQECPRSMKVLESMHFSLNQGPEIKNTFPLDPSYSRTEEYQKTFQESKQSVTLQESENKMQTYLLSCSPGERIRLGFTRSPCKVSFGLQSVINQCNLHRHGAKAKREVNKPKHEKSAHIK